VRAAAFVPAHFVITSSGVTLSFGAAACIVIRFIEDKKILIIELKIEDMNIPIRNKR
jgi:hypothetical protein